MEDISFSPEGIYPIPSPINEPHPPSPIDQTPSPIQVDLAPSDRIIIQVLDDSTDPTIKVN